MDISHTLEPTSEQLDAVELLGGPRIFTIERVSKGNAEQPVNVHLRDFPRPWRPGKSMRRVLVACWGPDASQYAGRRVELFCDPDVRFGGQAVGGTRISRLSHIDGPKGVSLLVARGKPYSVQPAGEDCVMGLRELAPGAQARCLEEKVSYAFGEPTLSADAGWMYFSAATRPESIDIGTVKLD